MIDNVAGKKEPNGDERITCIYSWLFNMSEINVDDDVEDDDDDVGISKFFGMNHRFGSLQCHAWINFQSRRLCVEPYSDQNSDLKEKCSCSASYEIYSDNDMILKTYNSSTVDLSIRDDKYQIRSAKFLKRLCETAQKYRDADDVRNYRVVVHIKLQIPSKFFHQPHKYQRIEFKRKPGTLPDTDEEIAFVYDYIPKSDFKIKCIGGEISAVKKHLFISSEFFQNIVKNDISISEWAVNHKMDVVQPIITYLHSLCFETPKVFEFDFAKRILAVIKSLQPIHQSDIKKVIFLSICEKFSNEPSTFSSILQWLSLAKRHESRILKDMGCTIMASEFYMKWCQKIYENPKYAERVARQAEDEDSAVTNINKIYQDLLITKVISP